MNHKEAMQKRAQDPEWRRKNKEAMQKRAKDPEWLQEQTNRFREMAKNPEIRRKTEETMSKKRQTPEWQSMIKEIGRKNSQNPEWRRKTREGGQKAAQTQEWIHKRKEGARINAQNPEWQFNMQETRVGGFWYGNVRYKDKIYCELWCLDLWHRIDEAQNYQSILSGKKKEDVICRDGKSRALFRHHIYWQPKACCEWDEDAQGYYAMINIGTQKKPNIIKYYIPGDPNKFVLLTAQEHGMVAKDKLKWIKLFEELIETKLNGVCYLPKVVS